VSLDVGTDRADLLADPLYLGYRAPRLRGAAYDQILEAFVDAVQRVFPAAVVQWEDFKQHNAIRVLERYRHRLPSFNDDIQGTAAVVLAGLLAARRSGASLERDRFLFIGAGAAAMGIASLLRRHLALDSRTETGAPVMALMDSGGLVHLGRPGLADDQRPFALDPGWFMRAGLTERELADPVAIARVIGASVLIGTTGSHGAFSEALVREVAAHSQIPIVLPLSNPGDRAEASPEDILTWTDGRALVATGGPGREVASDDGVRTIGQANNVFIFPGIGLAAIVAGTREVTDAAFLVAAGRLAELVTDDRLFSGGIYPPIRDLRSIARAIGIAVVSHLWEAAQGDRPDDLGVEASIDRAMWEPAYRPCVAG
jgi:malic enzyme